MTTPHLVATRVRDVPVGTVIPPQVKRVKCSGCPEIILLSPSSIRLVEAGGAIAVCVGCVPKEPLYVGLLPPGGEEDRRRFASDAERN